jgi:hypothetical protein
MSEAFRRMAYETVAREHAAMASHIAKQAVEASSTASTVEEHRSAWMLHQAASQACERAGLAEKSKRHHELSLPHWEKLNG